ncbi:cysteine-rich CWC family protein [Chitinibacter sp. FCG-7]|uniref:Cysteine-rich CWC family protein n=1 Tax=Chitinibacter mangrovi TaxID=3153927 RepID=A0AAU7FES4_9NEIS
MSAKALTCASCGAAFHCGADDMDAPCWCMALPPVLPVPEADASCLCPTCLAARLQGSGVWPASTDRQDC